IGAATISAFLLPATASAQPVTIPGGGVFEAPDEIPIPSRIPGIEPAFPAAPVAPPPLVAPQKPLGAAALHAAPAEGRPPVVPAAPFAPPPFVAPQKTLGEVALDAALSKVGSPYVYGAAGPNAFDCSGLVQWAYRQAGRELPRTSGAQLAAGVPVSLDNLQPG